MDYHLMLPEMAVAMGRGGKVVRGDIWFIQITGNPIEVTKYEKEIYGERKSLYF